MCHYPRLPVPAFPARDGRVWFRCGCCGKRSQVLVCDNSPGSGGDAGASCDNCRSVTLLVIRAAMFA